MRHINKLGLDIIKEYEGLRLNAYRCQAGVPTIGWGHTEDVKMGMTITEAEAEDFLTKDITWAEKTIENLVQVPLSDNQFSALVSLVFNIGKENFRESKLLFALNKGGYSGAAQAILSWHHVHGRDSNGLIARRKKEQALFLT